MIFSNISVFHASQLTLSSPYALISIMSPPNDVQLQDDPNRKALIRLEFDDLEKDVPLVGILRPRPCILFDKYMAARILGFVDGVKESGIEIVVIHCEAGISRSAAVAAALSKIHNGDGSLFFSKKTCPNMLVYRTIIEEANGA